MLASDESLLWLWYSRRVVHSKLCCVALHVDVITRWGPELEEEAAKTSLNVYSYFVFIVEIINQHEVQVELNSAILSQHDHLVSILSATVLVDLDTTLLDRRLINQLRGFNEQAKLS